MEVRKLLFPIALAIVWVVMAAMAMVDFANFAATTTRKRPVATQEKPLHSVRTMANSQARGGTLRAMPN